MKGAKTIAELAGVLDALHKRENRRAEQIAEIRRDQHLAELRLTDLEQRSIPFLTRLLTRFGIDR